jgi:hypothetical protein
MKKANENIMSIMKMSSENINEMSMSMAKHGARNGAAKALKTEMSCL